MLSTIKDYLLEPSVLLVTVLVCVLYSYLTSNFDYWLVRGVPYRKPIPLLGNFGNVLLFRKSQSENINEMYKWFNNEPFFGVFQVRTPVLVVRDPNLIKSICIKDFQSFCNRGIPENNANPLTRNLFNLEGKTWKSLRSKLTPVFSSGKLKNMVYLLKECSDKLVNRLENQIESSKDEDSTSIVNICEISMDFMLDVIGSCVFGIQINALTDDSEFRKVVRKLSKPGYKIVLWRMLRAGLPNLFRLLKIQMIESSATAFFLNLVPQMIKERENSVSKRHDFMDLLVDLKDKKIFKSDDSNFVDVQNEDIVMNEKTITAQAFVFFFAGYETSSTVIYFCLYELALNSEIQHKARCDIIDAINNHSYELTYDAIQDMKYLDLVVSETLRKYPPASFLSRYSETPYNLPNTDVNLPKGMRVLIPIYGIHHDPKYYPEPSAFKPERFLENEKQTHYPCTYIPFGDGPRSCIATRFAQLQVKVGIISFLRTFKFELSEKTAIPLKFNKRSLVTGSEDHIWLKISKI